MAKRVKVSKRQQAKKRATKRAKKSAPTKSPRKRKLSTSADAVRARARRAEAKRAAELAAKKRSKAAKKAAKTRRARRLELESIELGERERLREEREAAERRSLGDERQLMADVLEEMRNKAAAIGVPLSLELTEAEVGARTPWLVVGRFDPTDVITYAELDMVFADWRDDLLLEARIHPQRTSQIRLVYNDPNSKRGEGDSIVSHIGPWEAVISEITHELDPEDEDSLASRYDETTVPHFYVYFSGYLDGETEISL